MSNASKSGAVKRDFEFKLERSDQKDFPETYYGYIFAIKVKTNIKKKSVVHALVTVDDSQEGAAKIEIQIRNYVLH